MSHQYEFDWSDLAFASKKPLKELKATFIAAPREISVKRFTQIVKEYLSSGPIILGIAKEDFVAGFEGQLQFKTLKQKTVQEIINKVNHSAVKHKVYTVHYFQRDLLPIVEKLNFKRAVFINGSWKYAFHNLEIYQLLIRQRLLYSLVSPFADEREAKAYAKKLGRKLNTVIDTNKSWSEKDLIALTQQAADQSYDYNFQTGVTLAKKQAGKYNLLAQAHNKVVPYETFAMHCGASREANFSPPHDLNHYDTVHAEVELMLTALKQKLSLKDASVFINLLPCPPCARMLADTDIKEVIYQNDHSDGYAVKLLEKAGKKVRRVVI